MPVSAEQELAEYERRMDQMAVNIEKMRADMRWEVWKAGVSLVIAAAALAGSGVAIGNYLGRQSDAAAAAAVTAAAGHGDIVNNLLNLPVGSTITVPGINGAPDRVITVQRGQ
jgi:hypothetical protein